MKISDAVVRRIEELAREHKLSYSKWSIKSGLTPSTLYGLTNHQKGCPRVQTIKRLCDYIQLPLPEFFNVDYILNAENEEE